MFAAHFPTQTLHFPAGSNTFFNAQETESTLIDLYTSVQLHALLIISYL